VEPRTTVAAAGVPKWGQSESLACTNVTSHIVSTLVERRVHPTIRQPMLMNKIKAVDASDEDPDPSGSGVLTGSTNSSLRPPLTNPGSIALDSATGSLNWTLPHTEGLPDFSTFQLEGKDNPDVILESRLPDQKKTQRSISAVPSVIGPAQTDHSLVAPECTGETKPDCNSSFGA
jgi:hypothetical protein